MNSPDIVQQFIALYQSLNKDNLHLLRSVYSDDIIFEDALHKVDGLSALEDYFAAMYSNLTSSSIQVTDIQHQQAAQHGEHSAATEGQAYMSWVMSYSHPKLAGGKEISFEGVSKILYTNKITYHRDYTDMGQMLYEHIPVLGSAIRLIKSRALT